MAGLAKLNGKTYEQQNKKTNKMQANEEESEHEKKYIYIYTVGNELELKCVMCSF